MVIRFREVNRDIFEAIRNGKKKVETRAATPKYAKLKKGEVFKFVCGQDSFQKEAKVVSHFKTISEMLKKYSVKQINPKVISKTELEKMYNSFPGYNEKIKRNGLMVIELV